MCSNFALAEKDSVMGIGCTNPRYTPSAAERPPPSSDVYMSTLYQKLYLTHAFKVNYHPDQSHHLYLRKGQEGNLTIYSNGIRDRLTTQTKTRKETLTIYSKGENWVSVSSPSTATTAGPACT